MNKDRKGWQPGPLPPGTYCWGGVALYANQPVFQFADFCGDHVKLIPSGKVVQPDEILWFNNDLDLPPPWKQGEPCDPRQSGAAGGRIDG